MVSATPPSLFPERSLESNAEPALSTRRRAEFVPALLADAFGAALSQTAFAYAVAGQPRSARSRELRFLPRQEGAFSLRVNRDGDWLVRCRKSCRLCRRRLRCAFCFTTIVCGPPKACLFTPPSSQKVRPHESALYAKRHRTYFSAYWRCGVCRVGISLPQRLGAPGGDLKNYDALACGGASENQAARLPGLSAFAAGGTAALGSRAVVDASTAENSGPTVVGEGGMKSEDALAIMQNKRQSLRETIPNSRGCREKFPEDRAPSQPSSAVLQPFLSVLAASRL